MNTCLCACALCSPVFFVFLHIYKSIKTNLQLSSLKRLALKISLQMFCISAMILIDISLLFLYNKYVISESCWEVLFPTYQMKTGMMKKGVIVPGIVTQRVRLICENSAAFVQNNLNQDFVIIFITTNRNNTLFGSLLWLCSFPLSLPLSFCVCVNYLIAPIPGIYQQKHDKFKALLQLRKQGFVVFLFL